MKRFRLVSLIGCALLAPAAAAHADAGAGDDVLVAQAPRIVIDHDDTMAFAADELGGERLVKAAPYCADAVSESVQTLTDGNRIVRRQVTRLCRDGEGRTRQEVERGGRKLVYLRDPIVRESWLLDPERKSARPLGGPGSWHGLAQHDASAWREYGDKMREWAKELRERMRRDAASAAVATPPVPPVPPAPPTPVIVAPSAHELHRDAQIEVLRLRSDLPTPAAAPLPPGVALRAQLGAPRGRGVVTSLGTKDIDGLRVNGERTTWTIEAGKVGNERPIHITRDVWTSPELLVTVQSRDADPRFGETIYRLANLRRGEPDARLMKVPEDFSAPGRAASAPRGQR